MPLVVVEPDPPARASNEHATRKGNVKESDKTIHCLFMALYPYWNVPLFLTEEKPAY